MSQRTPLDTIQALDHAFNTGDLETILHFYDTDAVLLNQLGQETRGIAAIRDLYGDALHANPHVEQLETHIIEADGIALFTSRYILKNGDEPRQTFVSTVVLRQGSDGTWKNLIDNARGPDVLTPSA